MNYSRLHQAISKLLFCFRSMAGMHSFGKLIFNTKKAKRRQSLAHYNDATIYHALLNGTKRTLFLRTYAGDIDIYYEVFWKKVYSTNFSNSIECIVDIGANIGLTSIYLATVFKQATIVAVEPDSNNYELLLKNCAVEIQTKRIIPVQAAIHTSNTNLFVRRTRFAYNSKVSEKGVEANCVRGLTIKQLCKELHINKIGLLKMDIEGAEENLFASNFEWLANVEHIVIELHSKEAKLNFFSAMAASSFVVQKWSGNANQGLFIASRRLV